MNTYVDERMEDLGNVGVIDAIEVLEQDGFGHRVHVPSDVSGGQYEHRDQVGS